jgi:hypothetical protein
MTSADVGPGRVGELGPMLDRAERPIAGPRASWTMAGASWVAVLRRRGERPQTVMLHLLHSQYRPS